ncbi:hypothetical protein [Microbacterium testaceum]|uniref:hypothetical protein n=1 Tax=Microbacterium testaceum TaxID=2033 RepID=UPI002AC527DA|nr:hypothetical protein [Microbacterium testaceum]MDZ5146323.1 hypothetical protein [Microbacterium testaceum]
MSMRTGRCPPEHKHGNTPTCYRNHKCSCLDCKVSNTRRCYEHKKRVAYGRPTGTLVDAQPVHTHLQDLVAAGMTPAAIAAAAGVYRKTVARILRGGSTRRHPSLLLFNETAQKLLAVAPDASIVPDGHWVSARGTQRRLQALATLGWSASELLRRAGLPRTKLFNIHTRDHVSPEVHRAIARLYDELWDQQAPAHTSYEQASRTATRKRAAAEGWLPPLAWDDIDADDAPADATTEDDLVDELAVELALSGEPVHLTETERAIVIATVKRSAAELASVVGISSRHIVRVRSAQRSAA